MPTSIKGNEFYTENPMTGVKVDAHLHEPILSGVDKKHEASLLKKSRDRAKKFGLKPEQVELLHGKE